jgi:hypothetical protein
MIVEFTESIVIHSYRWSMLLYPSHPRLQSGAPHEGAFGRVLDKTPLSDPFATCRDVFRHNWRFVTATTECPVDFVTDTPPPDEWL